MTEHTPGPWHYTDSESGHTWWIETDADAATTAVATAWRSEADARLIAEAPRMYAALCELANAENLTGFTIGAWLEEAARIVNEINTEGVITNK